jgi:hypothetical protein
MREIHGTPPLFVLAKILGALPASANPESARLETKTSELAADVAEDMTQALTMCGSALIPAALMAMTKGEAAVPDWPVRSGLFEGTMTEMASVPRT